MRASAANASPTVLAPRRQPDRPGVSPDDLQSAAVYGENARL
jgi:hypothetical protein